MEDLKNALILFALFGAMLVLYGGVLRATGDENMLPRRASLSIRGRDDVRRIGRIVTYVGAAVIGFVAIGGIAVAAA